MEEISRFWPVGGREERMGSGRGRRVEESCLATTRIESLFYLV